MFVIKRDSSIQPFNAEEIEKDIKTFLTPNIQFPDILNELEKGLINHITTRQISDLLSNICASKISKHPDYNYLASAICIQKLHKETSSSYMETVEKLYSAEPQLVSEKLYRNVCKYKDQLEEAIDYKRDFLFDFFGLKTLERSYLKKIWNKSFEGLESNSSNRKDALGHNNEEFKFVHTSQIIERPQHLWMTVALGIHGEDIERAIETYHYMSKLYMIHATPTLFNASTNREQMSSCFIMDMEDNIENIFKTIGDVGQISKWAGGIGITLSRIRASGSKIKGTNGESSGLVPLCRTLNEVAKYINQGGKRNGSVACYLESWHADIYDFIELRKNTGDENRRARDLFLAIWACDLFMKRVQNDEIWSLMCPSECPGLVDSYGEEFEKLYLQYESEGRYKRQVKAKDLWMHILDAQIETGMPYMTFKDNTNHKSNQKNVGTIKSSNLCVAPETLLLTNEGFFPIHTLQDKTVKVWNGNQWSETEVKQTGENQALVRVNLSNGAYIDCTPYHKFLIYENDTEKVSIQNAKRVEANDLKAGMKLKNWDMIILQGDSENDMKYPYMHGFFCGDSLLVTEKNEVYDVPINATLHCRLQWLEGLWDSDGCMQQNTLTRTIEIESIHHRMLQNIRIMLVGMGVNAEISELGEIWKLTVSASGLSTLCNLGFYPKRLRGIKREPQEKKRHYIEVVSIEDMGRKDDTFCFTESINNAGVFNGILTGNCSEITEYYDRENIAVCNLGSICLQRFVYRDDSNNFQYNYEELLKVSKIMTRNLDRVIDANYYPVPETKNSNISLRPIGLGVQGLSDLYQIMKLPYGSEQARLLNRTIFETIYFGALSESNQIAIEKGAYSRFEGSPFSQGQFQFHLWGLDESKLTCPILGVEKWKELQASVMKYGTRNSLLTTCMPTASTSQIMRSTESFEPKTSNMYMRKTLSGEFIVMNEYLVKDLMELGLWTDAIRDEILYDQGSIQHIEEIPAALKEIYKTAFEMKQKDIVQQSIERGPFIDQSQSLNLFMAEPNFNQLASSHFYGWKNGLKTGMYYLRTQPSTNPIQFGLSPEKIQEIKEKRLQKDAPIFEEKVEEPVYKNCPIRRDERGKIIICESCT